MTQLFTFDVWWEAYQKKIGAKICKAYFNGLSLEVRSKIIDHTINYVQSTPDKQYRKNPLTYLVGEHWEDEILGAKSVTLQYKDVIRIHNNPTDERTMQDFVFNDGIWLTR